MDGREQDADEKKCDRGEDNASRSHRRINEAQGEKGDDETQHQ